MWIQIKYVLSGIGCIFILLMGAIPPLLNLDPSRYGAYTIFLALMAISTIVFGEVLFGYKLNSTDAINLLEPNGAGETTVDLFLIGGGRRIKRGKRTAHGKIGCLQSRLLGHDGSIVGSHALSERREFHC